MEVTQFLNGMWNVSQQNRIAENGTKYANESENYK